MKHFFITFSNNETWKVPIDVIAENRADYYACKVDGYEQGSDGWDEEVQAGLNDCKELEDWMSNNMDWENIKAHAILEISEEEYNYDSGFFNADIDIK